MTFTEFDNIELGFLRTACLLAALMSRQAGQNSQADKYHKLADKCEVPSSYLEKMNHLKFQLDNLVLSLEVEVQENEEATLVHPVSSQSVLDLLASKKFNLEKHQLQLPLMEELGLYTFSVHLDDDIQAKVKIWIVPVVLN